MGFFFFQKMYPLILFTFLCLKEFKSFIFSFSQMNKTLKLVCVNYNFPTQYAVQITRMNCKEYYKDLCKQQFVTLQTEKNLESDIHILLAGLSLLHPSTMKESLY